MKATEKVQLYFHPGSRGEGYKWASSHQGLLVGLCRQPFCQICDAGAREQLRHFRGGNLEVQLKLYQKPAFFDPGQRFYLAHLKAVLAERLEADAEGMEFDLSKLNALLFTTPDGAVLIDPGGMGFNGDSSPLRQLIGGQRILATVISHPHLDHWNYLGIRDVAGPVFMTKLTHRFASRHASLQRDFSLIRALREAQTAVPGQPLFLNRAHIRIDTIPLPHSVPETMGLIIRGEKRRVVCLGDFRLNGWQTATKAKTIASLLEIAKEEVDLLTLTIINAHVSGFTPMETIVIETLTDILVTAPNRVLVPCFSTNHNRIRRGVEIAQVLQRPVAFCGSGMRNAQELLGIKTEEGAEIAEGATVFVTGCQAEVFSILWRISQDHNPPFELRPDDTIAFSSRCIPGNEPGLQQLIGSLRPKVGRMVVCNGEIERLGLGCLGVEEALTHVTGHGSKEDLRLVLEILRPKQVLPWPQVSPQIEAFREIAEPLEIEILPETERVFEI